MSLTPESNNRPERRHKPSAGYQREDWHSRHSDQSRGNDWYRNNRRNNDRYRDRDRGPRIIEPKVPADVRPDELDPVLRRELITLDKHLAEQIASHLIMAQRLAQEDPELALEHARFARKRASRIAVVRETAGVAAYMVGNWSEASQELRAAKRMSNSIGLLPLIADAERGMGRPEKALEIGRSAEASALTGKERVEMHIVMSGARKDLGQFDQAVTTLEIPELDQKRTDSVAARLFYAYADALLTVDRKTDAVQWFLRAATADVEGETDAEDRAMELAEG